MKYKLVKLTPERQRENRRHTREKKRSMSELQELREVQEQFNDLIERMIATKAGLAGLALGASDAFVEWE